MLSTVTKAKRPVQKRSIEKVNTMLAEAEKLLINDGLKGVTIHKVAALSGVSAASVYQFFPTVSALLGTMAESSMKKGLTLADAEKARRDLRSWRDVVDLFVDVAFDFYLNDQVGNALFLNHSFEEGVRDDTCTRATRLGAYFVDILKVIYRADALINVEEKFAIFHEAQKSIYRRCITINHCLTIEYREEVRAVAYGYIGPLFDDLD